MRWVSAFKAAFKVAFKVSAFKVANLETLEGAVAHPKTAQWWVPAFNRRSIHTVGDAIESSASAIKAASNIRTAITDGTIDSTKVLAAVAMVAVKVSAKTKNGSLSKQSAQQDNVKEPAKIGNVADRKPEQTSRAARREAMREQGIPTSQQPDSQSSPTGPAQHDSGDIVRGAEPVSAGRQLTYTVPTAGGGTQQKSVQHSLTDNVEGHGPHWEAGPVKDEGKTDSVGRPSLKSDKSKVEYASKTCVKTSNGEKCS
jgi:hypothetical protein